jgi:hypothetical protein
MQAGVSPPFPPLYLSPERPSSLLSAAPPPGCCPQVPPTVDNLLESVVCCTATALGLPPDALLNTHRLDAGTSGVVVLAKTRGFAAWFNLLLKHKPQNVVKIYRCLTDTPPPLGSMVHYATMRVRAGGEPAHTRMRRPAAAAAAAAEGSAAWEQEEGARCELVVLQVWWEAGGVQMFSLPADYQLLLVAYLCNACRCRQKGCIYIMQIIAFVIGALVRYLLACEQLPYCVVALPQLISLLVALDCRLAVQIPDSKLLFTLCARIGCLVLSCLPSRLSRCS